jgi:hypothetical protein
MTVLDQERYLARLPILEREMKKLGVRDVPLGILLVLISQFFFYGVLYLAKFPSPLEFLALLLAFQIGEAFLTIGIRYVLGHEDNESK